MGIVNIAINREFCSYTCNHFNKKDSPYHCELFDCVLRDTFTDTGVLEGTLRCSACSRSIEGHCAPLISSTHDWQTNTTYYKLHEDDAIVKKINDAKKGFLKEPVRDPTKNMKLADLCDGIGAKEWEEEKEDMYTKKDSISLIGLCIPLMLISLFCTMSGACSENMWVFWGGILLFIAGLCSTTATIRKPTIKVSVQKYLHDPIFDNLNQSEAALCAKISKLPNKNKLIKQCKEYAQTLMCSKTDQSIEPLLTKLYNICTEQLNVGLKENVREIECFISAMEEVESRSEVLNSNG